jgi:hypothetical protein
MQHSRATNKKEANCSSSPQLSSSGPPADRCSRHFLHLNGSVPLPVEVEDVICKLQLVVYRIFCISLLSKKMTILAVVSKRRAQQRHSILLFRLCTTLQFTRPIPLPDAGNRRG